MLYDPSTYCKLHQQITSRTHSKKVDKTTLKYYIDRAFKVSVVCQDSGVAPHSTERTRAGSERFNQARFGD